VSRYVIEQPPTMKTATEENIRQIYSYLYRMNTNLQVALSSLNADNFTEQGLTEVRGGASTNAEKADRQQEAMNLRSLIIKTADTVQAEMDQLEATLRGEYLAISDFGTYQETVSNEIVATANEIVQSYNYDAQIQALADAGASFQDYQVTTEQYVKTGLLYYEGAVPRYGVAVGENLTTVIEDGEVVLERSGLCATFTSDRLSFWQGGVELAYVSNNQLHIANADLGQMTMGSWRVSHTDGFTIEWAG